jgi:predicted transcriptional regulator
MEMDNAIERGEQLRGTGLRHSILDLAPLELECLSVLWPLGQGSVRDIHRALAASRPRAYTTVLTIMDRLEQKGVVARHKVGRAFLYEPRLSAEQARLQAVQKIVDGFFDGSLEALVDHLSVNRRVVTDFKPASPAPVPVDQLAPAPPAAVDVPATRVAQLQTPNLDERLL